MEELDRRDFSYRATELAEPDPETGAESASAELPGAHRLEVDRLNELTGTPSRLASLQAEPAELSWVQEATRHLRAVAPALGLEAQAPVEFVPDQRPLRTSSDTRVVHLQQHYLGIPVFEMVRTVRFAASGEVQDVVGDNVAVRAPIEVQPSLTPLDAVRAACTYLSRPGETERQEADHYGNETRPTRLGIPFREPRVATSFPTPSRATTFEVPPLEDPVQAQLVLFHLGSETRLGWQITISLPDLRGEYELIVAANGALAGELLYCKNTLAHAAARGLVFRTNPADGPRVRVDFPPAGEPQLGPTPPDPGFFPDWVSDDQTQGNNVASLRSNTSSALAGSAEDGVVDFSPTEAEGADQRMLNAFYFCNYLHDLFLLLGFDEAAGNFQERNFTGAEGGGDSLEVRTHSQVLPGTAVMRSRRDGRNPEMRLGMAPDTDDRHTALDADIVFHEYAHGVTQRLVGGRLNFSPLVQAQSRAMGEGWSDYFALTIQNHASGSQRLRFGEWAAGGEPGGRPRTGTYGGDFPGHFGLLGTDDYSAAHDAGEIWCAALMRMNSLLGQALGDARSGHELGWQLVVDSLKLIAPSPSFLDGRDGLFKALDDMLADGLLDALVHATARQALARAFGELGMGPDARSNGASFEDITPHFA